MYEKPSDSKKWTQLVRNFKNTNGDLDLRGKDISEIGEGILEAGTLNCLDLSNNQIEELPDYLVGTNPKRIRVESNLLTAIRPSFTSFQNLTELSLKKNKISSFLEGLSPVEARNLSENFLQLSFIDLSLNQLREIPSNIHLIENLSTLNLGFNRLTEIGDIYSSEPGQKTRFFNLETLDLSSNKIERMHPNIYKLQKLSSLNLENNEMRKFPYEMGYLNLKIFKITGNPSMLIKNKNLRNAPALLNYLRERLIDKDAKRLDLETNEIRNGMVSHVKRKKEEKILEYEYSDPFK